MTQTTFASGGAQNQRPPQNNVQLTNVPNIGAGAAAKKVQTPSFQSKIGSLVNNKPDTDFGGMISTIRRHLGEEGLQKLQANHARSLDRSHLKPTNRGIENFQRFVDERTDGRLDPRLQATADLIAQGSGIDDRGIAGALQWQIENNYQNLVPLPERPDPTSRGQISLHDGGGAVPGFQATGNRRLDNYALNLSRQGVDPVLAQQLASPFKDLIKDSGGSALEVILNAARTFQSPSSGFVKGFFG